MVPAASATCSALPTASERPMICAAPNASHARIVANTTVTTPAEAVKTRPTATPAESRPMVLTSIDVSQNCAESCSKLLHQRSAAVAFVTAPVNLRAVHGGQARLRPQQLSLPTARPRQKPARPRNHIPRFILQTLPLVQFVSTHVRARHRPVHPGRRRASPRRLLRCAPHRLALPGRPAWCRCR